MSYGKLPRESIIPQNVIFLLPFYVPLFISYYIATPFISAFINSEIISNINSGLGNHNLSHSNALEYLCTHESA